MLSTQKDQALADMDKQCNIKLEQVREQNNVLVEQYKDNIDQLNDKVQRLEQEHKTVIKKLNDKINDSELENKKLLDQNSYLSTTYGICFI